MKQSDATGICQKRVKYAVLTHGVEIRNGTTKTKQISSMLEINTDIKDKQVLDLIAEKRTFINNILRRKANWIGHIIRNCLLHDAIEGQIMEVKGVG